MNHTVLIYSGNIIGGNDTKIRIFGNDEEYFFANDRTNKPSSQKDTINISSLKFEVNREKVEGSRSHVFVIRYLYTDNSSIKNCDFSTLEGNTYGVNPIDLYTTNTNTRIDNINSVLYTIDSGLTTHVCIRERYSNHTTKNVIVSNINGEKNGFDESIWIDAWYGNLEDVEVYDSEFKDKGLAVSSFYIAANYETSALRNIDVHNNIISKDNYSYKILSLGTKQDTNATPGMNENLNFHDNTIIINSNKESGLASGSTIVMVGESANKDANISDIFFENNTIISENALIGDVIRDNVGILNVKNNTIKVNNFSRNTNNFLGIYEGVLSIDNEHLSKTDGSAIEVKNVFRNCLNVKNITANINGDLVNDYLFTKSANYINLNITTSGKVFNITAKSTSTPTYNIENSTFTNSNNAYNVWYSDINSATSTNQQVTFNVTNTSFTNNNKYGSMTINNN